MNSEARDEELLLEDLAPPLDPSAAGEVDDRQYVSPAYLLAVIAFIPLMMSVIFLASMSLLMTPTAIVTLGGGARANDKPYLFATGLVIILALFALRKMKLFYYGVLEIVCATLALYVFSNSVAPASFSSWLAGFASPVYIAVRGLDNIDKGWPAFEQRWHLRRRLERRVRAPTACIAALFQALRERW